MQLVVGDLTARVLPRVGCRSCNHKHLLPIAGKGGEGSDSKF